MDNHVGLSGEKGSQSISHTTVPALTSAQLEFARVLGDVLANTWSTDPNTPATVAKHDSQAFNEIQSKSSENP